MSKKLYLLISLVLILLSTSSCTVVTNFTMSDDARAAQLDETLQTFHRDLYWGDFRSAGEMVAPRYRGRFAKELGPKAKQEKLVKLEVSDIDYDDSGRRATVEVEIQYYKIPNFVVATNVTEEIWYFQYLRGWVLLGAERVEEDTQQSANPRLMDAIEENQKYLSR